VNEDGRLSQSRGATEEGMEKKETLGREKNNRSTGSTLRLKDEVQERNGYHRTSSCYEISNGRSR